MQNVLLYTDTPQVGGAELQMFLLAKFLNKEKFTPVLACSNYPQLDRWCENFTKEGIKVLRLKVKHKHDPRHYFQLRKTIKDEKINLLHAHIWNPASCRYAFYAASSKNIPIITTEHDPFELPAVKDIFKKITLKKVNKIIAISENNKKVLQKLYPQHSKKIAVIHNGIDITWWQSQLLRFTEEERKKIKEEIFKAKESTLIITVVAELHERKGTKYLIEAMPEVVEKFSNIKLVVIGEGGERKNLEKLIENLKLENHVILLGRQKEIPKLLKSSDIFALPSRREAFGMVLLEAMLIPLPIIASNVGGIPEIIIDGKTGILIESENSSAIAENLKKLISSEKKRAEMAQAEFQRVLENFDAKKMAQEYEKVYKKTFQE